MNVVVNKLRVRHYELVIDGLPGAASPAKGSDGCKKLSRAPDGVWKGAHIVCRMEDG